MLPNKKRVQNSGQIYPLFQDQGAPPGSIGIAIGANLYTALNTLKYDFYTAMLEDFL